MPNLQQRAAAAVIALSATFSIVWAMASLGYPNPAPASAPQKQLLARAGAACH